MWPSVLARARLREPAAIALDEPLAASRFFGFVKGCDAIAASIFVTTSFRMSLVGLADRRS